MLNCTGESPENATVTIQCNETGVVYNRTYLVDYANQPMNITGLISVPQYQQCTISIVFSNEAGSSEPFILAFGKYVVFMCIILLKLLLTDTTIPLVTTMQPTPTATSTSLPTASPRTSSSG